MPSLFNFILLGVNEEIAKISLAVNFWNISSSILHSPLLLEKPNPNAYDFKFLEIWLFKLITPES